MISWLSECCKDKIMSGFLFRGIQCYMVSGSDGFYVDVRLQDIKSRSTSSKNIGWLLENPFDDTSFSREFVFVCPKSDDDHISKYNDVVYSILQSYSFPDFTTTIENFSYRTFYLSTEFHFEDGYISSHLGFIQQGFCDA